MSFVPAPTANRFDFALMDLAAQEQQFFTPSLQTIEALQTAYAIAPSEHPSDIGKGKNNNNNKRKIAKGKLEGDVTFTVKPPPASTKKSKASKVAEETPHIVSPDKDDEMDGDAKPKRGRKLAMDDPVSRRLAQNRVAGRAFRERNAMKMKNLEAKVEELTAALEAANSPDAADVAALKSTIAELQSRNSALEAEVAQLRKLVFNPAPVESSSTLLEESPAFGAFPPATAPVTTPDFMSIFNLFESPSSATNSASLNTPQSALSITPTGINTAFVQDFLFDDAMLSTLFPSVSPVGAVGGVQLEDVERAQELRR
ncbi:hypothetical protein HDU83_005519 [Entophlyctis luteolus]|nr:hypothetical protein HDU83_005519 [Entophlyctis luteolus]